MLDTCTVESELLFIVSAVKFTPRKDSGPTTVTLLMHESQVCSCTWWKVINSVTIHDSMPLGVHKNVLSDLSFYEYFDYKQGPRAGLCGGHP